MCRAERETGPSFYSFAEKKSQTFQFRYNCISDNPVSFHHSHSHSLSVCMLVYLSLYVSVCLGGSFQVPHFIVKRVVSPFLILYLSILLLLTRSGRPPFKCVCVWCACPCFYQSDMKTRGRRTNTDQQHSSSNVFFFSLHSFTPLTWPFLPPLCFPSIVPSSFFLQLLTTKVLPTAVAKVKERKEGYFNRKQKD